jgi:SAM-dependent methyltransferase
MLTLDIGCGENKHATVGIDINVTSCVDVVASTYSLPFKAETFDGAYMLEVLEHLENPSEALKEVNRVLKQDGTIRCSIPNVYWCGKILRAILRTGVDESYTIHEHINSWTIYDIDHLLNRCSFRIEDYHYGETGPYRRSRLIFKILRLNMIFKAITNHQLFFSAKKLTMSLQD